jgi:hypothetical protein
MPAEEQTTTERTREFILHSLAQPTTRIATEDCPVNI